MSRNSGKMALYEAIGKSRGKLIDGHQPIALNESGKSDKSGIYKKITGIVVVLLVALVIIFATKKAINSDKKVDETAQVSVVPDENSASSGLFGKLGLKKQENAIETVKPIKYEPVRPVKSVEIEEKKVEDPIKNVAKEYLPVNSGTNVIIVTRYMVKNDLVPVQEYFKKHGIDLEIIQNSKNYLLITTKRYTGGFAKVGSEAYEDLKTIKKFGAEYKAPPEYEPFGSKPFQDAYGMKLK